MKYKIFLLTPDEYFGDFKKRINRWLKKEKPIIKIVTQSESISDKKDWGMTISIWYEEEK